MDLTISMRIVLCLARVAYHPFMPHSMSPHANRYFCSICQTDVPVAPKPH